MSIRVETRNLNNGSSFVQTYETISGAEKLNLKQYSVSNENRDNFVKEIKERETHSSIVTAILAFSGMLLGAIGGYAIKVSRADVKPAVSFYCGILGFFLGAFAGKPFNKYLADKTAEKYNTKKL